MKPVNPTSGMQRRHWSVCGAILEPRGARSCPCSTWHKILDVFGQVVYSFRLGRHSFDILALTLAYHLDDVLCNVLSDG